MEVHEPTLFEVDGIAVAARVDSSANLDAALIAAAPVKRDKNYKSYNILNVEFQN